MACAVGFTEFTLVVPSVLAWVTASFVVALSIAFLAASAFAFTSAFAVVFSSSVKSLFASIASFLAFSASSIAFLAAGLACAVGFTEFTLVVPSVLAWVTASFVVALSIACFAASAFAFASSLAFAFSSAVKSLFASITASFAFNASSTAFFASVFFWLTCGLTLSTSVTPDVLALSTVALDVALSIACFAAVAFACASAFAAFFSSAVKSARASSWASFALSASSIAFLAAGLAVAVGVTELTLVVPAVLAESTAAFVVALSIAVFAAVAFACASAFAAFFSSVVKALFASIAASFSLKAVSIAAFAVSFFVATGLSLLIAVVPDVLALSNAAFVVTELSLIAVKAFVLSALTFSIAAAFSSAVAFVFELISAILSWAALLTASIAGCLFKLVNSDKGFVSVEPSLYVTTRFPLLSFVIVEILVAWLSTTCPLLLVKLASSLVWEYSIFTFSLIFSNSSAVTFVGSTTLTLPSGALISYFDVWFFTTNSTYPAIFWRSVGLVVALILPLKGALSPLLSSLATITLVHFLPAVRLVVPVILIVAVFLSSETEPSPLVTALSTTFPTAKP